MSLTDVWKLYCLSARSSERDDFKLKTNLKHLNEVALVTLLWCEAEA